MSGDLVRRIARLETEAYLNVPGNMPRRELSNEAKVLLREGLTGLYAPELIEQIVSAEVLSPPPVLSPTAKRHLANALDALPAAGVHAMLNAQRRPGGAGAPESSDDEIVAIDSPAGERTTSSA